MKTQIDYIAFGKDSSGKINTYIEKIIAEKGNDFKAIYYKFGYLTAYSPLNKDKRKGWFKISNPTGWLDKRYYTWEPGRVQIDVKLEENNIIGDLLSFYRESAQQIRDILEQGKDYNRSEMPQVSGEDLGEAYKLMKEKGIPVEVVKELPKNLKHSQKQINKNKVKSIIKDIRVGKKMPPLVISKDNWIVDGHHRQVGYLVEDPNEEKTMIKIGYPRDKAIEIYKKIENFV